MGLRWRRDLYLLILLCAGDLDLDPELDLSLDRFALGSGLSRSGLGLEIDRDLSDLLLDRDLELAFLGGLALLLDRDLELAFLGGLALLLDRYLDLAFLGGLLDFEGLELGEGSFRARFLPRLPLLLSSRCLLLPWESSEVTSSELPL